MPLNIIRSKLLGCACAVLDCQWCKSIKQPAVKYMVAARLACRRSVAYLQQLLLVDGLASSSTGLHGSHTIVPEHRVVCYHSCSCACSLALKSALYPADSMPMLFWLPGLLLQGLCLGRRSAFRMAQTALIWTWHTLPQESLPWACQQCKAKRVSAELWHASLASFLPSSVAAA